MSNELNDDDTGIIKEPEVVMEGKTANVVLDSQLFSSFMGCARKGNYRFNRNLVSTKGKSNALECGSYVHTIFEHYYRAIIAGKSKGDAISIGFDAGDEYVRGYHPDNKYVLDADEKGIHNTPLTAADASSPYQTSIEQARQTMDEYFQHYLNDMWTPIAVEEVRGDLIFEADDIRIIWKAKYDLIVDTSAGLMSVDHKTMKQRKDTMTLNNQFMGQCLVLKNRTVIVNKVGFQKTVKPHDKFTRPGINYTFDNLEEQRTEVIPYYARMWVAYKEANFYPPNYQQCENKFGMCEFYEDICRNDRGMREEALKIFFKEDRPWDVLNVASDE